MNHRQPNILFILSDQQRWDTISAYKRYTSRTPAIDRLASEGCLFRQAFTCQPLCGPARSCLQTGQFASQTGCIANNIALPSSQPTLAHLLRRTGYDVGYVGKWHLASSGNGENSYHYRPVPKKKRGGYDGFWIGADLPEYISNGYEGVLFDENEDTIHWQGYRADVYTDFAIRYLGNRPRQQPFFLFLSFVEPHPQPYHSRYRGPKPASRKGIIRDYLRYDAPLDVDRPITPSIPKDLVDSPGDWEEGYADYLACCESVDRNVARLIDYLQGNGLLDKTVIIYTSDHGCHFHTRHRYNDKCSCHENSIRIPGDTPQVYVESHLYDLKRDPHEKNNLVASKAHLSIRADLRKITLQWLDKTGQGCPEIHQTNKPNAGDV